VARPRGAVHVFVEGIMLCQNGVCESDRALPFLIVRKETATAQVTAERRSLCPKCIKGFRRTNRDKIRTRQLTIDTGSISANFRTVMQEFCGNQAPWRRGRL
jgi:hypothetical protein